MLELGLENSRLWSTYLLSTSSEVRHPSSTFLQLTWSHALRSARGSLSSSVCIMVSRVQKGVVFSNSPCLVAVPAELWRDGRLCLPHGHCRGHSRNGRFHPLHVILDTLDQLVNLQIHHASMENLQVLTVPVRVRDRHRADIVTAASHHPAHNQLHGLFWKRDVDAVAGFLLHQLSLTLRREVPDQSLGGLVEQVLALISGRAADFDLERRTGHPELNLCSFLETGIRQGLLASMWGAYLLNESSVAQLGGGGHSFRWRDCCGSYHLVRRNCCRGRFLRWHGRCCGCFWGWHGC